MGPRRDVASYDVQRATVFLRLIDEERIGFYEAEQCLRAWEALADQLGRPATTVDFWQEGHRWIVGELALKRRGTN